MTSVIQTKSGMRMNVMPGARMLTIVTMKLSAATSDATAEDQEAERRQKSMLGPARMAAR